MTCDNTCETFCPTPQLICAWSEYFKPKVLELIESAKPDTSLIDALLDGISIYDCDDETLYDCDDVVLYPKDGKFYKSLKNENDRDPQDSVSWEEYDSLKGMMSKVDKINETSNLSIQYHASCSGGNCTAMYSSGECVAIKVDTGEKDSCDNVIWKDVYYKSNEDKNVDTPSETSTTWDGPLTVCDLFSTNTICDELHTIPVTTDQIGG